MPANRVRVVNKVTGYSHPTVQATHRVKIYPGIYRLVEALNKDSRRWFRITVEIQAGQPQGAWILAGSKEEVFLLESE